MGAYQGTSRASGTTGYLLTQRGGQVSLWRKGKGGEKPMRRRIVLLIASALTAAAMTVGGAGAAFADKPPWKGNDKQFHNKCTGGDKHHNCKNSK
jgi:hypothetical protein